MLPIDPAELSAYLDGELPAGRAEEVRAALARDPELRQSYDLLVVHDADWRARAEATMIQPHVRFAGTPWAARVLTVTGVVLGLLLFRMALKALPPLYGASLEAILLVLVIGWGLGRILHATDVDARRPRLAANG